MSWLISQFTQQFHCYSTMQLTAYSVVYINCVGSLLSLCELQYSIIAPVSATKHQWAQIIIIWLELKKPGKHLILLVTSPCYYYLCIDVICKWGSQVKSIHEPPIGTQLSTKVTWVSTFHYNLLFITSLMLCVLVTVVVQRMSIRSWPLFPVVVWAEYSFKTSYEQ